MHPLTHHINAKDETKCNAGIQATLQHKNNADDKNVKRRVYIFPISIDLWQLSFLARKMRVWRCKDERLSWLQVNIWKIIYLQDGVRLLYVDRQGTKNDALPPSVIIGEEASLCQVEDLSVEQCEGTKGSSS